MTSVSSQSRHTDSADRDTDLNSRELVAGAVIGRSDEEPSTIPARVSHPPPPPPPLLLHPLALCQLSLHDPLPFFKNVLFAF